MKHKIGCCFRFLLRFYSYLLHAIVKIPQRMKQKQRTKVKQLKRKLQKLNWHMNLNRSKTPMYANCARWRFLTTNIPTQIVLTNERSIKFDDIGCMIKWMKENGDEEVGMAFVRDYNTEEIV